MRLVLGPILWGIVLGIGGALLIGRLIRTFLFDTGESDPLVLTVTVVAMVAVTLVACYLPARRASRIDPMIALRGE